MRLIDADKFKNVLNSEQDDINPNEYYKGLGRAKVLVDEIPTVEAEPIRHGKWIKIRYQVYECSCCKRGVYLEGLNVTDENETKLLRELYPYCHCGAKMNEDEERENRKSEIKKIIATIKVGELPNDKSEFGLDKRTSRRK